MGGEQDQAAAGAARQLRITVFGGGEIVRRRVAANLRSHELDVVDASEATLKSLIAADGTADAVVACFERFGARQADAVRRLKNAERSRLVVAVARTVDKGALATALSGGLDACVLEPNIDECLGLAVAAAQRGQVSVPRELSAAVSRPALSVREKQILALVVMGFSNADIARQLYLSESTVKSHLSSAFVRLGVRSRSQAAALILDPEAGLGAGILTISGDERRRGRV